MHLAFKVPLALKVVGDLIVTLGLLSPLQEKRRKNKVRITDFLVNNEHILT